MLQQTCWLYFFCYIVTCFTHMSFAFKVTYHTASAKLVASPYSILYFWRVCATVVEAAAVRELFCQIDLCPLSQSSLSEAGDSLPWINIPVDLSFQFNGSPSKR